MSEGPPRYPRAQICINPALYKRLFGHQAPKNSAGGIYGSHAAALVACGLG